MTSAELFAKPGCHNHNSQGPHKTQVTPPKASSPPSPPTPLPAARPPALSLPLPEMARGTTTMEVRADGVAVITISNPPVNALSLDGITRPFAPRTRSHSPRTLRDFPLLYPAFLLRWGIIVGNALGSKSTFAWSRCNSSRELLSVIQARFRLY